MWMNHTGGVGQTGLVEATYVYTLPTGWKEYGTNNTGAISSSLNTIVITPIAGATANCADGQVTVRGYVPSSLSCGSPSQPATIAIQRTGSNTISLSPSYAGPSCGNITPITFTAPTFSCQATYTWTKPSGWSGSSTSNTITLTPSGSHNDAGTIKATITFGCSNSIEVSYTTLNWIQPVISGPSIVCSSGTFTVLHSQGSISWTSGNTSILTINSSGVASKVGSASGQVIITASLPCSEGPLSDTVYVGTPYFNTVTYDWVLTNSACDGGQTFVTGLHTLTALVSGATGYPTFTLNGPSTVHGTAAGNDFTFDVKRNDIFFDISYTKSNTCGIAYGCTFFSNSGGPEIVTPGDDELLSVYPNPVQNQITIVQKTDQISVTAGNDSFSAQFFDPQGGLSKSGESANGKIILDTSDLPKGMYYLHVLAGGEIIRKQILKDK